MIAETLKTTGYLHLNQRRMDRFSYIANAEPAYIESSTVLTNKIRPM